MLEITNKALELISKHDFFKKHDVRFVGGTALSYLINHRLSEDLDFAMATSELPKDEIIEMMESFGAIKKKHSDYIIDSATNHGEDIDDSHIMFDLNGVKVDFFTPPFNIKEKVVWEEQPCNLYKDTNVKVASFETIFYMKTMAFWNRKKYRDVYDVYYVLNQGINGTTPQTFLEQYMKYNISYTKELLLLKIQSKKDFSEKKGDEGINILVEDDKPYEWYRDKLEDMINDVYLEELYNL
jgi:predicted nucleotidyltransferase component of viral defense system